MIGSLELRLCGIKRASLNHIPNVEEIIYSITLFQFLSLSRVLALRPSSRPHGLITRAICFRVELGDSGDITFTNLCFRRSLAATLPYRAAVFPAKRPGIGVISFGGKRCISVTVVYHDAFIVEGCRKNVSKEFRFLACYSKLRSPYEWQNGREVC